LLQDRAEQLEQASWRPSHQSSSACSSNRIPFWLRGLGSNGTGNRLKHLARDLFHGKRGELYQRYREGQEDQLSALGLVMNVIVLWNMIYMDAALSQLRLEGYLVCDEDVARLSPFGYEHINMLGRYSFVVPESVTRGELRPLRNPSQAP
jgi:hypothetical protein